VQTRRFQESFEDSYSSLAYSSGELSRVIASYSSCQWETHAFSDFGGKMFFLGHNFGSRHARSSIKGSIDAGDYLVSKKSLSQHFGPLDWHPGPIKVGQKTKNTPTFWAPPRRTPHPNQKKFFFVEPLAASVEGLNNSLAKTLVSYNQKTCTNLLACVVVKGLNSIPMLVVQKDTFQQIPKLVV